MPRVHSPFVSRREPNERVGPGARVGEGGFARLPRGLVRRPVDVHGHASAALHREHADVPDREPLVHGEPAPPAGEPRAWSRVVAIFAFLGSVDEPDSFPLFTVAAQHERGGLVREPVRQAEWRVRVVVAADVRGRHDLDEGRARGVIGGAPALRARDALMI